MLDIVTLGEILIQLNPLTTGPLRNVAYFERHVAGSEANVAVAATRMGLLTGIVSRVGNDEFGKCITSALRGEGVDVSHVQVDNRGFTGVYFIQRDYPVPGKSKVFYYRAGSSCSRLGPQDLDDNYVANSKLLYLTGITPALSKSCLSVCMKALQIARREGLKIAFDTNIRPILWSNQNPRTTILPILREADVVFTDAFDLERLMGQQPPDDAAKELVSEGASCVVLKRGAGETTLFSRNHTLVQRHFDVPVVDSIGAGDAFAGVFISGYLKGWDLRRCLKAASVAGALTVTGRGDQEYAPSEEEIEEFLRAQTLKHRPARVRTRGRTS